MEPFLGFGNGIFDDFCCQRLMDTVETTVLHRLDRPDLMSRVEDVWLGNLSTIFNSHRAGLGENVEAENGPLKKEHPWNIHGKSGVNVNKMCISLLVLFGWNISHKHGIVLLLWKTTTPGESWFEIPLVDRPRGGVSPGWTRPGCNPPSDPRLSWTDRPRKTQPLVKFSVPFQWCEGLMEWQPQLWKNKAQTLGKQIV